jgi:hypothetical protein
VVDVAAGVIRRIRWYIDTSFPEKVKVEPKEDVDLEGKAAKNVVSLVLMQMNVGGIHSQICGDLF